VFPEGSVVTVPRTLADIVVTEYGIAYLFGKSIRERVLALANIAPDRCLELYRLFTTGAWDKAAELQRRMIPVNASVTARFGIAGLKAALDMLGYYGGPVRSPLLELTRSEGQTLKRILLEGGILK